MVAFVWSSAIFGLSLGCSRSQYRQQADQEAYAIIAEKLNRPKWMLPRVDIQVDPDSRMFDPFDPDRPPMPQDDPVSHELMHCVDGKPNFPDWGQDGYTNQTENPAWLQSLPVDERGVLKLDLKTAVRLALKHSPDYQEEFEDLYLSALDVSAERFQFDTQFFGGTELFQQFSGKNSGQPRSQLSLDSNVRSNRAFIRGAELAVGLANSIVWNFHGPNSNTTSSLLDFSLVQPLLRGAGRDRVLTRLTLAERQLLANVRQMERFRRGFYLEIATGDGNTAGARRIGGLFGGSGLEGFTGVGGGFGGVGGAFGGGGAQAAADALQVGGYLGLLQDQQNIRNQRSNIAGLRANVVQFQQTLRENLRTIPDDPTEMVRNRLQIAQARQTLYNQEFALISAEAQYQSQVDNIKVELGLPPQLCAEIDDPLLNQFNLLDTAIVPMQNAVSSLSEQVGAVNEAILESVIDIDQGEETFSGVEWSQELESHLQQLQRHLVKVKAVRRKLMSENIARAEQDLAKVKQMLPGRVKTLTRLKTKYPQVLEQVHRDEIVCQQRLPVDIDPFVLDVSRLEGMDEQLRKELDRILERFESYEESVQSIEETIVQILKKGDASQPEERYRQLEENVLFALPGLLADINSGLLDLSLIQARARAESIDLVPIDLDMNEAVCIASINRRDWMNARASLVDTWRAIAFVANDLEGVLDLVFDGSMGTVGDNPAEFRSTTGTLRMGVRFEAPFTRLLERNNYRQVLIDYQQGRRGYYQFVDRVSQGIRRLIRTADLNELNFETRRVAVLSAIEQIVLNDEIQTLNEERGEAQGVTAARDIVQALSDLQDAQDAFMGVWLTYEVNRQFLDYDLGTMELDENGMWVDKGPIQGGVAPYVCDFDCTPLLGPNVTRWLQMDDTMIDNTMQFNESNSDIMIESVEDSGNESNLGLTNAELESVEPPDLGPERVEFQQFDVQRRNSQQIGSEGLEPPMPVDLLQL